MVNGANSIAEVIDDAKTRVGIQWRLTEMESGVRQAAPVQEPEYAALAECLYQARINGRLLAPQVLGLVIAEYGPDVAVAAALQRAKADGLTFMQAVALVFDAYGVNPESYSAISDEEGAQ